MNPEIKLSLTINEIEYADNFDEHYELYNKAIRMLKYRLATKDFTDFTDEELELLEEVYRKMEMIE